MHNVSAIKYNKVIVGQELMFLSLTVLCNHLCIRNSESIRKEAHTLAAGSVTKLLREWDLSCTADCVQLFAFDQRCQIFKSPSYLGDQ